MSLHQNVGGTIKQITTLTQNVGGALKTLTSFKQNVSGTLKELLSQYVATLTGGRAGGSNASSSNSPFTESLQSGESFTDSGGANSTGQTGYSYFKNITISSVSLTKTCTFALTGTFSGSGNLSVKINGTELVTTSPVSISKTVATSDTIVIQGSAAWGYQDWGFYDFTLTIT